MDTVAALSSLPLGSSTRIRNIPVRRASLFGFQVAGGALLELGEAATELETLLGRVRIAAQHAERYAACRGLHGVRYKAEVIEGTSLVRVVVAAAPDGTRDRALDLLTEILMGDGFFPRGDYRGNLVVPSDYN